MKKSLIMIVCAIVVISIGSVIIVNNHQKSSSQNNSNKTSNKNNLFVINAGSIADDDLIYKDILVKDYTKYQEILSHYEMQEDLTKDDFIDYDYLAIVVENDYCGGEIHGISDAKVNDNIINITVDIETSCSPCPSVHELYFVRFDKNIIKDNPKVNIDYNSINKLDCDSNAVYKPIIYLYPNKDMEINVKVGKPEYLTTTYPKYNNGWKVRADKNGNLIDEKGRSYYALYWEGKNTSLDGMKDEGFVIKGNESSSFLEEKLALLGLNEREANEFIMYWLPKLEYNKYNYIRFATIEEINDNMPLIIEPKPDNIIRVMMIYKPLNEFILVKEQKLDEVSKRNGFTVVEWGGTELQ